MVEAVTARHRQLSPFAVFAPLSRFTQNPRKSADLSTLVLLRCIAQLEATVGRLSEDLSTLRSAVSKQGLQLPRARGVRARGTHTDSSAAQELHAQAHGGLAGAAAHGEAARVQWVKDGLVIPGEQLARAWGLTRQALAPAADRGEIFAVKVGNRLYYARAFRDGPRDRSSCLSRAREPRREREADVLAARAWRPRRKNRCRRAGWGDCPGKGGAAGGSMGARARRLACHCGCLIAVRSRIRFDRPGSKLRRSSA